MATICKEQWYGFKRTRSETTVSEKMGRTLWSLAAEMIVNHTDSRERTTVGEGRSGIRGSRICGIVQYYRILLSEKLIPEGLVFRTGVLCGG
jgi:hypothetical protein